MSQVTDALSATTKLPGASGSLLRGVCAVGCTFLEAGQSQGWGTAGSDGVGMGRWGEGRMPQVGRQAVGRRAGPMLRTFHTFSHFISQLPYEACTLLSHFTGDKCKVQKDQPLAQGHAAGCG